MCLYVDSPMHVHICCWYLSLQMTVWLHKRYVADASHMALLTMGGRNSGKSYTLFGGNIYNYHDRGIVPRLLAEIFNPNSLRAEYLKLSFYIIDGENFIDMLVTPPRAHAASDCVYNSPVLGQIVLNMQEVVCTSALEAVEVVMKALINLSLYTVSTINALHSYHTVVNVNWVGPNAVTAPVGSPIYDLCHPAALHSDGIGIDDDDDADDDNSSNHQSTYAQPKKAPATQYYSLLLVEVAGTEYPPIVPAAVDRLSTFGYQFASIRLLLEMTKRCPSNKYLNALTCINHSALTWLLQNSLFHVRLLRISDCFVLCWCFCFCFCFIGFD